MDFVKTGCMAIFPNATFDDFKASTIGCDFVIGVVSVVMVCVITYLGRKIR